LPALNASRRAGILEYLQRQFGVPPTTFADVALVEGVDGEVWVSTPAAASATGARRPPGLRAIRPSPQGPKPTSAFLVSLGHLIVSSRVEFDAGALRALLLGRRLSAPSDDGYVALSFEGRILGCGLVSDGVVRCLIPTGRRQELLDVLPPPGDPESREM